MIHVILLYFLAVTFPVNTTTSIQNQYDKNIITIQNESPFSIGEVVITGKKPVAGVRVELKRTTIAGTGIKSSDNLAEISPLLNVEDTSRGDRYIYLSGYNYKEIQLYLDGVPFYIPYSGDIGADIVKLISIEKIVIEPILPSLFYGPNAMGGAINILSRTPEEGIHGRVNLEYSSYNEKNGILSISGREKGGYGSVNLYAWNSPGFPLSHKFTPDLNEDGGLRENSYSRGYTFFGTAGYEKSGENFITLRYYKTSMEKGVPPEVGSERPRYWRFTDWEKELVNLVGRKSLPGNYYIRLNSAYVGYYNVLDSYDDSTYSTQTRRYAFHSTYNDHSLWNSIMGGYQNNTLSYEGLLIYKKDIHREQPDYNEEWNERGEETYSAGLRFQLKRNKLLFSSEGRYDYLAAFGNPNIDALNYRFAVRYLLQQGEISAIFGSTTRFPTMKERYSYRLGRSLPNPDLRPEKQNSVLLTGNGRISNLSVSGYIFYSRLTDLIESIYVEENILQNQNINKALIEGFYFDGETSFNSLEIKVAIQGLWAKNLTSDSPLPYRPRWKINALGKYSMGKFMLGMGLNAQYLTFYQDSHTNQLEKLPGWYTLMAFIEYRPVEKIVVYLRGTNLLDRNYETEKNFPAPGREIFAGIRGEF